LLLGFAELTLELLQLGLQVPDLLFDRVYPIGWSILCNRYAGCHCRT
jgi:hypothetical protein